MQNDQSGEIAWFRAISKQLNIPPASEPEILSAGEILSSGESTMMENSRFLPRSEPPRKSLTRLIGKSLLNQERSS